MKNNYPIKAQKNGVEDLGQPFSTSADSDFHRLMPYVADSTRLTVVCRRSDYSASRIARAIEDCDAHVLNLNLTADTLGDSDEVVVDVRVDRLNVASMARSLERYGYSVAGVDRDDLVIDEDSRRRIDEFLRYLDV